MDMRVKLLRLVKCLAYPHNEIVGPFEIGPYMIDSIEIIKDELFFNIWIDSLEQELIYDDFTDLEIEDLVKDLEKILLN